MKTIGIETACRTNNYYKCLASARLRCYDLINYFKGDKDIKVELYDHSKKYDVVIFQKLFNGKALALAQFLRNKGTKTVFDIGTNYLDLDPECVSQNQQEMCIRMLEKMDWVSVSSPFLKDVYSKAHESVHFINDAVEDRFLKYTKQHTKVFTKEKQDEIKLIYCGYSAKAKELNFIKNALLELWMLYQIKILYISDKNPGDFLGIPYEFVQFNYAKLPEQLMQGDIKISPRNLDRVYNMGHSVVKIAYPMSIGLPVVASPIPSYIPYLQEENICRNNDEWFLALERLIWQGTELRQVQGAQNKELVKEELCLSATGREWKAFFEGI
jgi:hypothetical protein